MTSRVANGTIVIAKPDAKHDDKNREKSLLNLFTRR